MKQQVQTLFTFLILSIMFSSSVIAQMTAPTLSTPIEGDSQGKNESFNFFPDANATNIEIQISSTQNFASITTSVSKTISCMGGVENGIGGGGDTESITDLFDDIGLIYFWRVRTSNNTETSPWSAIQSFVTDYPVPNSPCGCWVPDDTPHRFSLNFDWMPVYGGCCLKDPDNFDVQLPLDTIRCASDCFDDSGVFIGLDDGSAPTQAICAGAGPEFRPAGMRNGIQVGVHEVGFCGSAVEFESAALPVDLTTFTATKNSRKIFLNWRTEAERNNAGFYLERSANGRDFVEIAYVSGAGTTSEPQDYSYTDRNPLSGQNYYRLVQKDHDGKIALSGVITIFFITEATPMLTLMPSAFGAGKDINFNLQAVRAGQKVYMKIVDTSGRVVHTDDFFTRSTNHFETLATRDLQKGIYVVNFNVDGLSVSKRMVVK